MPKQPLSQAGVAFDFYLSLVFSHEHPFAYAWFLSEKNFEMKEETRLPHPLVATLPVVVLIGLLSVVILLFGSDSLSGGSQMALLMGTAVCVFISMVFYRVPWKAFENQFMETIGGASVTLLILLTVGMIAGSWMISGVVPTLIYYGVQILSPQFFLACTCIICSLVSLLSGSSWTTIATIGVALMGIGQALGVSEAWTAGAIISGAYFGDKMSPLSDTTIWHPRPPEQTFFPISGI